MELTAQFQQQLNALFAANQFYTQPSDCWVYGYDNSRKHALPNAVVFAHSQEDIINIVKLCYEHGVPLTARGRASGTTGAAIPLKGGVVLSLERMQTILQADATNRSMIVEPGVLNATVQAKAKEIGFFWPPDPTSSPYCSIGGNLACNASGPRSLKYGSTRDNVLGLTAITGTGEVIECGVHTTKGVVGYDFTRLLIGQEGTLAIISQAILKLTPLPEAKRTLRAFYRDNVSAAQAVAQIMSQSITPCGCEFIDGNAIQMIRKHANADLPESAGSMLMIEVDGSSGAMAHDVELMKKAAAHPGLIDLAIAHNNEEAEKLWAIRKSLSQALRSLSPHKINEDVVVPVSQIPTLLAYTEELAATFDITIVNFGHAGNGNLHVNLLVDPHDPVQGPKAKACLNLLFDKVVALQGSLSGEHGVGVEKRDYVNKELSPASIALMKKIKAQFDPKMILNPDKLFPLT
ncbi:FAD-linked oxidase C-terminal domain-containing protein [Candidatus Berkiella aquae]|uniref:FAD-binding oxidoreductase n=1 Tax=Candidatus Berkiella aquae TaxID=295108 RepID=A0A0Q9YGN8_9GAMM|nr:FAD-binding oxidoreductase [Candidatus Berkiella aquae]MCS5710786.1 FAD-binding oxidoreductase [Candidatus Berkiella aquae]